MQVISASLLSLIIGLLLLHSTYCSTSIHCRRCKLHWDECKANLIKHRCFYTNWNGIPIPKSDNDISAAAPTSLKVTSYVLKTSNHSELAINVSWTQTRETKEGPKGYLFRIQKGNAVTASLRIYFNFSNFSDRYKIPRSYYFIYHDVYVIKPGTEYYFNLMSIPMYQPDTDIAAVETECSLGIEDCKDNPEYSDLRSCKWKEEDKKRNEILEEERYRKWEEDMKKLKKKEKQKRQKQSNVSISAIVIPVLAVVLVILIAVVVYGRRNRKKKPCKEAWKRKLYRCCIARRTPAKGASSQKLLIVTNSTDEARYQNAANMVATMLGEHHAFNLWRMSEDPQKWVEKNMRSCDHVLFLCTPQGKRGVEKMVNSARYVVADTFALVYNQVLSGRIPFTTAFFDSNPGCVPSKLLKGGKSFQLPEKIKQFLRHTNKKEASDFMEEISALKEQTAVIRGNGFTNIVYSALEQSGCEEKKTEFECGESTDGARPVSENDSGIHLHDESVRLSVA